jgi:RNA polymerase sigma-70 factor (ECF subfamily)
VLEVYEGRLTRYVSRLTGDIETARDVVQDTFLRLCRQRRTDVEGHVAEWLYRVARNRTFDLLRKQGRLDDYERVDVEACPGSTSSASMSLESRDDVSRVLEAIDLLSLPEQEVLRLKFQDGLKYREIANVTGRTTSYVGVLIHTAIKKLRAQLAADEPAPCGE